MNTIRPGLIWVVSAPSGSGKTTLCQRLLNWSPHLIASTSCTTREPRPGEQDGREYFFLTHEEFERKIAANKFLEYTQYNGNYYGTPRLFVEQQLAVGQDVLLTIDVHGMNSVAERVRHGDFAYPNALVTIFMMPPSLKMLEARLRGRGTESEEMVQQRLSVATEELTHWRDYDYILVSGGLDDDFEKARSIFIAEKLRVSQQPKDKPWQVSEQSF